LDATNALDPLVSVLTSVSLDHRELLGNTLRKIASEKSYIMRTGKRTVIGPQAPEALRVFRARAKKIRAFNFEAGRDFACGGVRLNPRALHFDWSSGSLRLKGLSSPLLGFFQADNASAAVATAEILRREFSFKISDEAIRRGLRKVSWPGRVHILKKNPLIVADGAHNGASMKALAETIQRLFPRRETIVIIGTSRGKELSDILREMARFEPLKVIVTKSGHARALPAHELARAAKRYFDNVETRPSLKSALVLARRARRGYSSLTLITGSLFLVGEAMQST
ncbi:MAG: cyanophycin synthetase, partial [Candidatus Omnitrophica bacterium]|nr:cyanophycin synthetase [Candidatus Omnitrophota bacterium]